MIILKVFLPRKGLDTALWSAGKPCGKSLILGRNRFEVSLTVGVSFEKRLFNGRLQRKCFGQNCGAKFVTKLKFVIFH